MEREHYGDLTPKVMDLAWESPRPGGNDMDFFLDQSMGQKEELNHQEEDLIGTCTSALPIGSMYDIYIYMSTFGVY